jgi:hypothetical protein
VSNNRTIPPTTTFFGEVVIPDGKKGGVFIRYYFPSTWFRENYNLDRGIIG